MRSPTTTIFLPAKPEISVWRRLTGIIGGSSSRRPGAYPGERPLDGVEEVFGDMVGLDGPLVAPVLPLAAAVAGEHEHRRGARRLPRFDIAGLVADHHRPRQVQAHLGRGAKQEARLGLPARAILAVRRLPCRWMVRAHVERVEPRALDAELALDLGIDGHEYLAREIAAGYAGLV